MSRRVGDRIEADIHALNAVGEGVGSVDGLTVFIEGALPQERVEARLIQMKKRYARGSLLACKSPSPERREPVCPVFGQCGGCQLMHLDYKGQLEAKRRRVQDALDRIGHLKNVAVAPCLPSPQEFGYRNKIRLPVNGSKLGLYARASHDIVEIDGCPIHCDIGEQLLAKVRQLLPESGLTALKSVTIRSAVSTQETLALFVTDGKERKKIQIFAERLMREAPLLKGVVLSGDKTPNKTLCGKGAVTEELLGLSYRIPAPAFFQVNRFQAEALYKQALEFAALTKETTLLDPFCGVGAFTLLAAQRAKKAIGIETVPEAAAAAKENARLNGVENAAFHCGLAEELAQKLYGIDTVFLNPPRKGCRPELLERVGRLRPKSVVYMSCDPATLARDLALLEGHGLGIEAVQPVDMFPQTMHVETLVKLKPLAVD